MSQAPSRSMKRKAESRTIIAISRQSSRSAPKITKEELQYRHEQNNETMRAGFVDLNVDWADADYLHHELLVMPSNENVATQAERVPQQIRSDIKDRSALGPVMILTSQADGWTTNTAGLAKLFRDYCTTTNVSMFVAGTATGYLEFTASHYLKALALYTSGQDIIEYLEPVLEYIEIQVTAGQAKQQMSQAHLANIAVLGNDTTARNSAVGKKSKPTTTLTTTAPKSREVCGVLLAKDSAGQIICPDPDCSSTFKDEKALRGHLVKAIKDAKQCVLCPPDYEMKSLKDDTVRKHVKSHINNGRKEKCDECGELTTDLAGHTMVKHGSASQQLHPCSYCGKGFKSVRDVNKHERDVHTEDEIKCEYCGSGMKPASLVHHHKYGCVDSPTFKIGERVQCPDCTATPRRQNFGRHMKVHKRNIEIASILEGLEAIEGHETDDEMFDETGEEE